MYNPLKNKMSTYFFNTHVKDTYEKVLDIENKEEVYYHKNKLAILIKDEEIGERIFEIVKNLKNKTISTEHTSFKISKYISDKADKIQLFYVDFTFKENWNYSSKLELLQEFTSFVHRMQENGYILDESLFKKEECNCVSQLLSSFVEYTGQETDYLNGLLINFIHYVLTDGRDLNEDYQKIHEKGYCSTAELFYNLPITRMCYEYYLNGNYDDDIYWTLVEASMEEPVEGQFYSYLMFDKTKFESNSKVVRKDNRYTVYDSNIKIYNTVSHEFEDFLKVKRRHYLENTLGSIEEVDEIFVDLNEQIVGYKFSTSEGYTDKIIDANFDTQHEVFNYIVELNRYLKKINNSGTRNEKNDFDIEKCVRSEISSHQFKVGEIQDFFDLINYDVVLLENQITLIFFKIFLKYIRVKHGIKYTDEEFLNITEVRYLSPILAREFINYALERTVDYKSATADFDSFFSNLRKTSHPNIAGVTYYDSKFEYNPVEVPFIFDYELEKKYGIKFERGTVKKLSDGRYMETFQRRRDISKIKEKETLMKSEIDNKFSISKDNEKFKFVTISEIIYLKDIDSSDRYGMIGYISEPIKGVPIMDYLTSPERSNRDFLKVAAYLFKEFEYYNIPLEAIYIHDDLDDDTDEDFVFYIDLTSDEFTIRKTRCGYYANSFVNYMAETLMEEHLVNSQIFIDLNLNSNYSRSELLQLIDSFDSYCNEHNIYYSSKKTLCPICLKTKLPIEKDYLNENTKLFEDEYAIHYKWNQKYNVKVYKETNLEKLSEFGKNVDFIINNSERLFLNQNCFIPVKKAIDETTKKFIGYVYETVDFEATQENLNNLCVDFNDLQRLTNLVRIKCLTRFITQVKDLVARGFGFIENPFNHVYRVKGQKKQVQILNIDFLRKHENLQNTEKWACEYAAKIIALDENINCNIHGFRTNFDHVLSKLSDLTDRLTKKCSHHKMYYDNKHLFCPKCIDPKQLITVDICRAYRSDIRSLKKFNEGGESYIYTYGETTVAKVFKDPSDPELQNLKEKDKDCINMDLKYRVMASIIKKRHILEKINRNKKLKFKYVIPKRIFVDEGTNEIFGYVMDKIENATALSILKDKTQVEKLGLSRKDIFEILITVGQGIETLHKEANIYIGDLNGRNILFDTDKNVYFLDFDGMGMDDIQPEFCTDGYIDPISRKNRNITMKDDWYSFAVQVFHYLTYTHPFNGIYMINGRALEITEKMENRISLLGNYGMKPPTIAIPWDDWMIPEFKKAFFTIFEGDNRESIVPYLIKQYEMFEWNEEGEVSNVINVSDEEIDSETEINTETNTEKEIDENAFRINPKFIATRINPFEFDAIRNADDIAKVINENAAVYLENGTHYVTINKNGKSWNYIPLPNCLDIKKILLTDDDKFAAVVYEDHLCVLDLTTNVEILEETISSPNNVVINNNTLYLTRMSDDFTEHEIIQVNILDNGLVTKDRIRFMNDQPTKGFYARRNSKFIVIKESSSNGYIDEVYCNAQKLCEFNSSQGISEYNIVYDEITKNWLIVDDDNHGIVINSKDGSYKEFSLEGIPYKVENINFNKGNIYIPSYNSLYIICTNNQFNTKRMECNGILTADSKVFDINNNGFSIITDNNIYEIRRG